jgi:chromosome partitioning protein
MSVAKIVAIANQKGGVGKTTTCVNLAASLAYAKKNILLVDMDPQGNATMGSGVNKNKLTCSVNDLLMGRKEVGEVLVKSTRAGYDILPGNGQLTEAEVGLLSLPQRERHLQRALLGVRDAYDFILLDCPPSLNMLTVNGLVAANSILIPMPCEYFALEGLSSLMSTLQTLQRSVNPALHLEGLVRTLYDPRNRLSQEVTVQLIKHFGEKVYKTVIPRNVRLAEAPSHGLPVLHYDKNSSGAQAYLALAGEFLKRQRKTTVEQPTLETQE